MSENFTVEIISPNGTLLKLDTSEATIPSYEGEMGIQKDHISIITFLRPGLIKIKDNKDRILFVEEGTVEFINDNLLILTSTAKELSDIDKSFLDNHISDAEKKMHDNQTSDKDKYLLSYKINTLKNINQ